MTERPNELEPDSTPRDCQDALSREALGTHVPLREERRQELVGVLQELADQGKLSDLEITITERLYGPPMTYGAIADAVGKHPRFVVETHGRIVQTVREGMTERASAADQEAKDYWLMTGG